MGRPVIKDEIYNEMIAIVKSGVVLQSYLISKLREKHKISRQALEGRIKVWDKNKIIKRKGQEITLLVSLQLNNNPADSLDRRTVTRQENYCLKYPLKDPLDPKDPPIVVKSAGYVVEEKHINGSLQATWHVSDITCRLNTKSLELWCPHIYSNSDIPSIIMEAKAKEILDAQALRIEHDLQHNARFKLIRTREGALISERVDIELEEEEHLLAQAKPKDYKFSIYHPIDNALRAKIDFSRGESKPEVALVHRKDAGVDRDTMNKQFNMLFNGDITFEEIKQTRANLLLASEEIKSLSLTVNELTRMVRELMEKRII